VPRPDPIVQLLAASDRRTLHNRGMTSRGVRIRGPAAAALLLAGLLCFALWRVVSGTEALPFAKGAAPPTSVRLTVGKTYSLAVPGGVRALVAHGVPASSNVLDLSCQWSLGNADSQALSVTPESVDTKAEATVAHFPAPLTGRVHIVCANWGVMFVPDSDDRPADTSGWFLLLSTVLLTTGGALALAALRAARLGRLSLAAREDDEIEGLVDIVKVRSEDGEVGHRDGGDIAL